MTASLRDPHFVWVLIKFDYDWAPFCIISRMATFGWVQTRIKCKKMINVFDTGTSVSLYICAHCIVDALNFPKCIASPVYRCLNICMSKKGHACTA